jgi:hypothetical protein
VLAVGLFAAGLPIAAFDEVVLKNGRTYTGRIVSDGPDRLVLAVDGGTVEFPRASVASPPLFDERGREAFPTPPIEDPVVGKEAGPHPIPSIATALRELRRFAWTHDVRQMPVLVTDRGRWQFVPSVSFRAADLARVNFYGDPDRPAAVEVSLLDPPADAWELKRDALAFILAVAPVLALDDRFDRLDVRGDSLAAEDLWLTITAPDSKETPGRWTVVLLHERALAAARASLEELRAVSEPLKEATLDPTRPRSWQRATWTVSDMDWLRRSVSLGYRGNAEEAFRAEAWTALGGERVFVRSFVREGGKYARSTQDWLRQLAAGTPPR